MIKETKYISDLCLINKNLDLSLTTAMTLCELKQQKLGWAILSTFFMLKQAWKTVVLKPKQKY